MGKKDFRFFIVENTSNVDASYLKEALQAKYLSGEITDEDLNLEKGFKRYSHFIEGVYFFTYPEIKNQIKSLLENDDIEGVYILSYVAILMTVA